MDRSVKQLLFSLLLGLVFPVAVLNVDISGLGEDRQPVVPTLQATEPSYTQPTETAPQVLRRYIPVLNREGVVDLMALDDYILGVVLAEMPASFELEALKAQSVVARTYALRRHTLADRHTGAAVCTDSGCCQAYVTVEYYLEHMGTQSDVDKIALAVALTEDEVLTYEGKLVESTYFSCSGGRTENAAAVWGSDIAYLQAVDSPGEEHASNFVASVYFSAEAFAARLGRQLQGMPGSWLGEVALTDGGGVKYAFIGGISYTGTQLRTILDLNSTAFTMSADEYGITVTTKGKGHRVGMSQYGADAMALTGAGYQEILSYYYCGTIVDKLGDIG